LARDQRITLLGLLPSPFSETYTWYIRQRPELTVQLPQRDVHLQFQKWAKKYGPIYSLMLGTKTLVVLSNSEAVKELMDKKSNIYSSKPDMYVSQDLISGGYRMLFMKYGQTWRMVRKMCHQLLNIQAAKGYVPYQVLENKQMLNDLLDTPDDFVNHMRRLVSFTQFF
jgi:cytochrome P450